MKEVHEAAVLLSVPPAILPLMAMGDIEYLEH